MQSKNTAGSCEKIWLNGALTDAADAAISPFDHGLLTGDGVFETLKAYRGEPFAQTRHYWRLVHSATHLGLTPPLQEEVLEAMRSVLKANDLESARIRVTLTGGVGPLGSDRGDSGQTFLVAASPLPEYKAVTSVITVDYPRNEKSVLAGLKTTSYAENVVALQQARISGCSEAIFGNLAGSLCEGTGTNIFVVRDGSLMTPPLASGCLAGVTRSVVIDLCEELEIELEEAEMPLGDLAACGEAFLTSTLREVQAISAVNDQPIGEAPGPLTARLAEAFRALTLEELDP